MAYTETLRREVQVKAQRGLELRCKNWRAEAILRMLENNLENGEKPEELIIYTGVAKAARSWEQFDLIVRALKNLREDQTLVMQSGKPIAIFDTHERAPMVIMANGNVVGNYAEPEDIMDLEEKGLTVVPGMTAAAWQYIGSQGIIQGTYQSFIGAAEKFGGTLAGRTVLTAGSGGMGGAQPLAGKMAGAATLVLDVQPDRLQKRIDTGYLDVMVDDLDEALRRIDTLVANKEGGSVGLVGNAAEIYPKLLERNWQPDIVTDQTITDPYRGYFPAGMTVEETLKMRKENRAEIKRRAQESIIVHAKCMIEFEKRGATVFEYGNGLRYQASLAGFEDALQMESFITLFIRPMFCEGMGPFRWVAISGDEADIHEVDDIVRETFSANHPIVDWINMAEKHIHFTGLPARIGWLGHTERTTLALKVNEAVASGRLTGPIAFTRDHLDSGSVASPMRETERMKDGSAAIADWAFLNAMLNVSSGGDLIAVHGGQGGRRSQCAGVTTVADGSALAAKKIPAIMNGDTGIGVLRHADAGYEKAIETKEHFGLGLRLDAS
jgi:urocanate hydratase